MATAMREPATRVLVVDDHPMVREGLRSMLQADGVEVVAEAATGAEALSQTADAQPDLVLLDLELPDMDGLAVLRTLRESGAQVPVLVITMHQDADLMRRVMAAGANGYVLKGIGRRELLATIRAVSNGESVLDPTLLRLALERGRPLSATVGATSGGPESAHPTPGALRSGSAALSRIEVDLLRLIAAGLTNRQIANHLRWSQATVKKYVQRVLEKLGAADRTQAAAEAVRRGLVD
jgi:DNA-binding NarL/FixJ family response regulator